VAVSRRYFFLAGMVTAPYNLFTSNEHIRHNRNVTGKDPAFEEGVASLSGEYRRVDIKDDDVGPGTCAKPGFTGPAERTRTAGHRQVEQSSPGRYAGCGGHVPAPVAQPLAVFEQAQFFHRAD
jgi:hypothetical protein